MEWILLSTYVMKLFISEYEYWICRWEKKKKQKNVTVLHVQRPTVAESLSDLNRTTLSCSGNHYIIILISNIKWIKNWVCI